MGKEQTFVARYTSDLWDRKPELDLTGPDFILEKVIRGEVLAHGSCSSLSAGQELCRQRHQSRAFRFPLEMNKNRRT
ncbi:hypothetical protein EAO12_27675 [Klebsiella pneumoniae]|nr:hypothetical protein EAO12_27675 [Klebsiella pneumoniae]